MWATFAFLPQARLWNARLLPFMYLSVALLAALTEWVVLGKEPIRSDGRVVGYATSAGYGYSVGRCIVYGYLPVELAVPGTPVEVEYFDERLPATVAEDPLWDPKGERLRA